MRQGAVCHSRLRLKDKFLPCMRGRERNLPLGVHASAVPLSVNICSSMHRTWRIKMHPINKSTRSETQKSLHVGSTYFLCFIMSPFQEESCAACSVLHAVRSSATLSLSAVHPFRNPVFKNINFSRCSRAWMLKCVIKLPFVHSLAKWALKIPNHKNRKN